MVDEIVKNISKSVSVSEGEATECRIQSLHNHYEQSFVFVGMKKGVVNGNSSKKMDAASVEAMLSEVSLNTKNLGLYVSICDYFSGDPILNLR